jgi:hypothetical protein
LSEYSRTMAQPIESRPSSVAVQEGFDLSARTGLLLYGLIWLLPALLLAWRTVGGTLAGDLFEHAAAVRELATNPGHPVNPIVNADLPHTLFSPYSLLAAAVVRLTRLDPFNVLTLFGFVNVVVLAAGFRAFVRIFSKSNVALVLGALFAFFLWGSAALHFGVDPLIWSGFLNLNSLSYGLPYPSALAMGLAFLSLSVVADYLRAGGSVRLLVAGLMQTVLVVIHPYTALFVVAGVTALIISSGSSATARRCLMTFGAVALGSVLALAWPYFSILALLTGQVGEFDPEQRQMYSAVLLRILPALVGLVAMGLRFREDRRDPLAWLFGLTAALYAVGFLAGRFTLGRELPYVIVCLDVALAIAVGGYLAQPREVDRRGGRRGLPTAIVVAVCLVPVLLLGASATGEVLTTGAQHADVEVLDRFVGQYQVVLADQASYPAVPPWGGKLVSWNGALAFVPDIAQRRADAAAFFGPTATEAERQAVLQRYGVRWVIYDRQGSTFNTAFESSVPDWGRPYAMSPDGVFVLVAVGS